MAPPPSLILKASHSAGFGDLLRCLLVAIAYAKVSGRSLYVDWRGGLYGHPVDRNLFDDLFDLVDLDYTAEPPSGTNVHPPRWSGVLDRTFAAVYDEDGNLKTSTLAEYLVPAASDVPPITTAHTVTPSPTNQLGVKGIGEAGTIGAASTVMNAVIDALSGLGVTEMPMPASPHNVWKALQAAKK